MNIKAEFLYLLEAAIDETGVEFEASKMDISQYMAERAMHLSTIAHEPGFAEAVVAERNNVAMRAGLAASLMSDAAKDRLLGMIGGALRIAAIALI